MNKQTSLDMSKLIIKGLQESRIDPDEAKILVDRYLGVRIPSTQPNFNDKRYAQITIHAIPPTNRSSSWSFVAFANESFRECIRFVMTGELDYDWYERLRRPNYARPFTGNPMHGDFRASIGWLGNASLYELGYATFDAEIPMSNDMADEFVTYCSIEMDSLLADYISYRRVGIERFMSDVLISNSNANYIERITKEVLENE